MGSYHRGYNTDRAQATVLPGRGVAGLKGVAVVPGDLERRFIPRALVVPSVADTPVTAGGEELDLGSGPGGGIPQGGPLTENLDGDGFKITNLLDPEDSQDATTKAYVDDVASVPSLNAVLESSPNAGTQKITNLGDPEDAQDAATKQYVDTNSIPQGGPLTDHLEAGGQKITFLDDPEQEQDAATKAYVDTNIPIRSTVIDLDAADIATLSSVPVQVVAAPGAGKVIVPVSASFQFKTGAVAFDASSIVYVALPGGFPLVGGVVEFEAAQDIVTTFALQAAAMDQPDAANQPLTVTTDEDPAGVGDGTARLQVLYYVMDLA